MDSSVDKNGDESGGSSSNEVTAEWVVRAQLKITQPKKKKSASFASGDCGARRSSGSPCRIVYKWTSDETKLKEENQTKSLKNKKNNNNIEKTSKTRSQPTAEQNNRDDVERKEQLDTTAAETNKMMKSTCSIVLTTDLCPMSLLENNNKNKEEGCTTHTYTFSPDQTQIFHETRQQQHLLGEKMKMSVSKDVSCQTSDCEVIPIEKNEKEQNRSTNIEKRRRFYSDHRRATDSLLSPNRTKGNRSTPSRSSRQESPALSNLSSRSKEKNKKPPRTVHIDVYCTGSDVESSNSSNSSTANIVDNIANLMAKQATVIEADDMLLRHRKVSSKNELPRKLMKEQVSIIEQHDSDNGNQFFDFSQVLLQNSANNEREELNESKQMLFKKYLGDQRQIQKFNELKSMLNFRRQTSDDAISSNYPNSSHSTIRDFTSSSLASVANNSPSTIILEDSDDWKDLDRAIQNENSMLPFNYDNIDDKRFDRIKEFQRLWRRPEEQMGRDLLTQQKLMENFLFVNDERCDQDILESDYQKSNEMGNISDSSPSTVISLSHKRSESIPIKVSSRRPTIPDRNSPSVEISPMSTLRSNFSKDHYELATKFGSVIKTMRKPGHHVGPVRNPTCLCETCKRWTLERDQVQNRERAYSFGETPITRSNFWRRNNRYYV